MPSKQPDSKTTAKIISVLEQSGVDFEQLLKLWAAETQPDLVTGIERFILDASTGVNSASAVMLLMALSFEAGRATQVGMMYLESVGKWPKGFSISGAKKPA